MCIPTGKSAFGALLTVVLLSSATATSLNPAQPAAEADEMSQVLGNWQGGSSCVAKNTACRDEAVVYHIAKLSERPGYVSVSADKMVAGKAINMGVLEFRYNPDEHTLTCEYSQGIWRLKFDGGTMEGTLTQPDRTVFRRVTLRKEP